VTGRKLKGNRKTAKQSAREAREAAKAAKEKAFNRKPGAKMLQAREAIRPFIEDRITPPRKQLMKELGLSAGPLMAAEAYERGRLEGMTDAAQPFLRKLRPIVDELYRQGRRNSATVDFSTLLGLAGRLDQLISEYRASRPAKREDQRPEAASPEVPKEADHVSFV
jgi:hypothetical protein